MQLKTYQQKALEQLARWVDALDEAIRDRDDVREFYAEKGKPVPKHQENYPAAAWQALKEQGVLPTIEEDGARKVPDYIDRTAASGAPIPHVCMKVPTGGGKTLLGVAALEKLRTESGFVLWIVPTRAIYEQTIKAFKTREHPYRAMLERIAGGRVKLLEKDQRFSKQDVASYLCVMLLMLPAANRQRGREFLKIFRDSGGYESFFPAADDWLANEALAQQHADLERHAPNVLIKQSLCNTLKRLRPIVILDEAHKAYGSNDKNNQEFVRSVNRLNPRFVLELSATPKISISNILVNIGGTELKEEEMIKLPIEVCSFTNSDWQHTIAATQAKLNELEQAALKSQQKTNRYIRPIALVRVQRTGSAQRQPGLIHAEDVREYLIKNLAVPPEQIRVQSSEQKELAGEDLLDQLSAVRWIITKDALKEGWDCAFAYILALLDNTRAKTALTQMLGRVMRQPQARSVDAKVDAGGLLNRCYVYCYNEDVGEVVKWVRAGLEKEGLSGLGDAVTSGNEGKVETTVIHRRKRYRKLDIFLPQVLHKDRTTWRLLDYERDILGALNWDSMDAGDKVSLGDGQSSAVIRQTVDVQGESKVSEDRLESDESVTLEYFVRRLSDTVPNPWQAARMAMSLLEGHQGAAWLLQNRLYLADVLIKSIQSEIDQSAERLFRDKINKDEIRFHLLSDRKLNYALEKTLELAIAADEAPLCRQGRPVQQSLFEPVFTSGFNGLEKDCALYLDQSNAIYWWHKIAVRQGYGIQGWRRHRVYPDFVACKKDDGQLLIMETKGLHLKGNEDTQYKTRLLQTLERVYQGALDRGEMKVIGETPAVYRILLEDSWKQDVKHIVADSQAAC